MPNGSRIMFKDKSKGGRFRRDQLIRRVRLEVHKNIAHRVVRAVGTHM